MHSNVCYANILKNMVTDKEICYLSESIIVLQSNSFPVA